MFFSNIIYAQAPRGQVGEYIILDNLDTLNLQRQHSDWWFGVSGGANIGLSLNKLFVPEYINEDGTPASKKIISYNTGSSKGFFIGLYGEWLPVDEMWGATLRIDLFDYRNTLSKSDVIKGVLIDSSQTDFKYVNTTNAYYLNISPEIRYNLAIEKSVFICWFRF